MREAKRYEELTVDIINWKFSLWASNKKINLFDDFVEFDAVRVERCPTKLNKMSNWEALRVRLNIDNNSFVSKFAAGHDLQFQEGRWTWDHDVLPAPSNWRKSLF